MQPLRPQGLQRYKSFTRAPRTRQQGRCLAGPPDRSRLQRSWRPSRPRSAQCRIRQRLEPAAWSEVPLLRSGSIRRRLMSRLWSLTTMKSTNHHKRITPNRQQTQLLLLEFSLPPTVAAAHPLVAAAGALESRNRLLALSSQYDHVSRFPAGSHASLDYLDELGTGIDRRDPSTWSDDRWPTAVHGGIIRSQGIGHSAVVHPLDTSSQGGLCCHLGRRRPPRELRRHGPLASYLRRSKLADQPGCVVAT